MGRGPGGGGAGFRAGPGALPQRKSMVQEIAGMGQPLFSHEAPTGYPEDSREWVSSGSLLARFNFSQDLSEGSVAAISIPLTSLSAPVAAKDHKGLLAALSRALMVEDLSSTTRAAIFAELETGASSARAVALILGSPEFQKK